MSPFALRTHKKAFRTHPEGFAYLIEQLQQEIGDDIQHANHGDKGDHGGECHPHRSPVGLPLFLESRPGRQRIALLSLEHATLDIRHIRNGAAVVIVPDFLFLFLLSHGSYASSSRWQAAKWPGSCSLYSGITCLQTSLA